MRGQPVGIHPDEIDSATCFDYRMIPDYLNDLNAMHEAEISYIITNGLWDDYVGHLKAIMYQGERFWGQATAKQRAEAFLRTITPLNA